MPTEEVNVLPPLYEYVISALSYEAVTLSYAGHQAPWITNMVVEIVSTHNRLAE